MAAKFSKFEQGTPPPGYVDTEVIRLTKNGVWLADGHEITHEPTLRLFAKSLKRDEKSYFLHVGREMKRIEVEDTAYFIERVEGSQNQGYTLFLNDGTSEKLNPGSLKYQTGRLTCLVHQGEDEAKFLSIPYMELLKQAEEDEQGYFLKIEGKQIRLGATAQAQ
jgi:hypothetical protein